MYDDENRLTNWFHYANGAGSPANGDLRSDFTYDGLGRLGKRLEYSWNSGGASPGGGGPLITGSWGLNSETHYIYDGYRVIQERDGSNNPIVSYTRGTDLSGTMEGAGGIGGLLSRSSGYSSSTGNWSTHYFYHADGNGNITYLADGNQALAASYRFDPFGNTMSSTGTLASANVYRFSSKEVHANSGMYYYGFRFYDPNLQRWINRDPIEEEGGINLYGIAGDDPVNENDPVGLNCITGVDDNGRRTWWGPYNQTPPGYVFELTPYNQDFIPSGWTWGQDRYGNWVQFPDETLGLQPSPLGDLLLGGVGSAARGSARCVASRWGRGGLQPRDWVMKGRPNLWNYFRSGKWQPGFGNEFASPSSGQSFIVSPAKLQWPSGFGVDGYVKGLFGQRIYSP